MLPPKKLVFNSILCLFIVVFGGQIQAQKVSKKTNPKVVIDTTKNKSVAVDTIKYKLKAFKTKAHASYYHNKFNGKRTSSGIRFSNNKYTAAHRKLPFGTKLKVTNEENGKWVIVEVIDRGPFSRGREIDLSRRAFMEIASNKNSGVTIVKLEIIEN
ncbi:MAG: septal ring lytic transglycosylase RlpA family protein [Flavobacteriaceae bacterium]|jgi:rare lipoprotein A|nr:septal ring lytic transglycosylase RlpA family protein [Flavobacteriaceae bacterium]